MMFQTLGMVFSSKYLENDTLYEISFSDDGAIRIRPYTGDKQFDWLRWSQSDNTIDISIPTEVKKLSKIGKKVYAIEIDGAFYLVPPDYTNDPSSANFVPQKKFFFYDEPSVEFLREADAINVSDLHHLPAQGRRIVIPSNFAALLGIGRRAEVEISVFSYYERKWLELKKAPAISNSQRNNNRISYKEFIPELSGITICAPCKDHTVALHGLSHSNWDPMQLYCWFSKVRNALIIESKPEKCAICDTPIRSLAPEHHRIAHCPDCESHLGKGNAINTILHTHKILKSIGAV